MPLQVTARVSESERHLEDVYSVLFRNGKLFSSAADGKVKVWSSDLKLIKEFQAHQSVVYDMAIIGNTLYTCSNDGKVLAWDVETFEKKATLLESENEIYKFYVDNEKLYAGDDQGVVRLWENDEFLLVFNLVEEVRGLVVTDKLLFTVRDRDVCVTEIGEKGHYATRKTIEGSSPICLVGNKVCFVSRSATNIIVIDATKETGFKELNDLKAHDMVINVLREAGDSTLYSGSYDKFVKQWDLNSFKCLSSCDTGECINALAIGNEGQVYAAGPNGFLCRIDNK
ncbi:hypothetical protein R5R35_010433 [Gryllus longicercus]|uniref:Uncharacterized protein n=1 Tax=Gryllus longicercus TaxID=2509291 RepID=A0AAN9VR38_9ORTH